MSKDIYGVITLIVLNDGTDEIFHLHGASCPVTDETTLESLLKDLYFDFWVQDYEVEEEMAEDDSITTLEEARVSLLNYRSYFVLWHPTTSEESAYQSIKWILDTQNESDFIILPSEQFVSGDRLISCLIEMLEHNTPYQHPRPERHENMRSD